MHVKLTLFLGLSLIGLNLTAQNQNTETLIKHGEMSEDLRIGKTDIRLHDNKVSDYLQLMDSLDQKTLIREGYRIQLYSKSGPGARELTYKQQAEFLSLYRTYPSYVKWNSPNWVLSVGDFRTRLEAAKFREEFKVQYPASFIIADEINSEF
jgi:hypothetical protein